MITLEQYKRELKEFCDYLVEHADADYKALELVPENVVKLSFDVIRLLNGKPDSRPLKSGKKHGE